MSKQPDEKKMVKYFSNVDQVLKNLGFGEDGSFIIYQYLACILHLTNIDFEATDTDTRIIESSNVHLAIASKLMNVSEEELKNAFLFRLIDVAGSDIA